MLEGAGAIMARSGELFCGTDSFGQSLIAEVIEPMMAECAALVQMAEEVEMLLARIDADLAEVRAMGA